MELETLINALHKISDSVSLNSNLSSAQLGEGDFLNPITVRSLLMLVGAFIGFDQPLALHETSERALPSSGDKIVASWQRFAS